MRVCRQIYKEEVVKLTLQISEPDVLQIKKDKRVTFEDQVSSIGGTLGLFAGASIISLVEAIFWTYKANAAAAFIIIQNRLKFLVTGCSRRRPRPS